MQPTQLAKLIFPKALNSNTKQYLKPDWEMLSKHCSAVDEFEIRKMLADCDGGVPFKIFGKQIQTIHLQNTHNTINKT